MKNKLKYSYRCSTLFKMAIGFLDEPENQQFVVNDDLVRHQMFLMDYMNLFMRISIAPLHIVRRFQYCLRIRLINYPMFTFQSIRDYHIRVEIPEISKNSFVEVLTTNNGNDYGNATLYLAAIHPIRSLSLFHFRVFLLVIEQRVFTLTKLTEKLCVMLNGSNSEYLNYFLAPNQNAADYCIETKRKILLYFLERKVLGKLKKLYHEHIFLN